ncbi:hypothetical protein M1432_01395 [Patescibacteria group bacterium]|nr:hypothetical protein [Patescibacteria group bacterium]
MKDNRSWLNGLVYASGTFIYVSAVAWFIFNSKTILGQQPDNFLMPLFMLLLFVVSAGVTGTLVLGKPIQLYLSGAKKEGAALLVSILAWLAAMLAVVVAALAI